MSADADDPATRQTGARNEASWRSAAKFSDLTAGHLLAGRYRILGRLGRGGSGEVFRCRDELAEGDCAVKVLYPGPMRPPLPRLRRELRLMRPLSHPGLVQVHDIGEADGLFFVVMEYVTGETLAARIRRRGALTAEEAENVVRRILQGLQIAHDAGVLHRDVKPGNILLSDDGQRVVLLDFGLAWHAVEPTLTGTGGLLGTPQYMSPEQASGGSGDLTPASDLYSLGVVLWEMLTGAPPFDGESAMGILRGHVERPLPSPRHALRGSPERLRSLALALLEKRRNWRPASARVALAMLGTPAWRLRPRRWLRTAWQPKHRGRQLALGAAGVVAVGALLLYPARPVWIDSALTAENLVGLPLWKHEYEAPVWDVRPYESSRRPWPRWIVTLARPPHRLPESYGWGFSVVDPVRRREAPLQLGPTPDRVLAAFPGYDGTYAPGLPQRLPWDAGGQPTYLTRYSLKTHYPRVLVAFNERPSLIFSARHPGELGEPLAAELPDGTSFIAVSGLNNLLGQRGVVLGLPGAAVRGSIMIPPYTTPLDEGRRDGWYVFLTDGENAPNHRIRLEGETLIVGNQSLKLDARTGVPLDPEHRDSLDEAEWLAEKRTLDDALLEAAHQQRLGNAVGAARRLASLAENLRVTTHRAVANARAAELYRDGGSFAEAEPLVREAQRLEPRMPGHLQLSIDLLVRRGDRNALEREEMATGLTVMHQDVVCDLVLAWLIEGLPERGQRLAATYPPTAGHFYGTLSRTIVALHQGDAELALQTAVENAELYPEFRYLALLASLLRSDYDPVLALRYRERPEITNSVGEIFPVAATHALMSALETDTVTVPLDELIEENRRQREAARSDVFDLYLLGWGEVIAEALLERPVAPEPEREDLRRAIATARQSGFADRVRVILADRPRTSGSGVP